MDSESIGRRVVVAVLAAGVVFVSGSAFGTLFFPEAYAVGPYALFLLAVFLVGFLLPDVLAVLSSRRRGP